jgi:actin-like ATPase involved in cell morphogenesis
LEDLESLDLIKEVNGIDSLGKIHEFYSLDKDHQFYVSDEQSKLAVCTPVTINGHHANALVDTGAKAGNGREIYVDEEFARQIHLEI